MSKKTRKRTREDILAKRQADDERRTKAIRLSANKPVKPPGPTLLFNPFHKTLRSPGGVILVRPNK